MWNPASPLRWPGVLYLRPQYFQQRPVRLQPAIPAVDRGPLQVPDHDLL